MSELLYTCFTKLIIDYLFSLNKSIPRRSSSKLHSLQDDHPITKLLSTTNGEYKFRMEVPDAMISDAIKKKAGYKYYMAKKVESKKAKIIDEPKEQHVSPIKSRRGKGFMCCGDQVSNVPNKLKKDVVPRKTRSFTIAEEAIVDELANSINTASDATLYASSSDKPDGSANETDDADKFEMDLSDDNPHGDDDDARYGVFMHNKCTATPNSTYLNLTVTSSLLDFIQTFLDETPVNELMDFMSHPVYIDAQTTSVEMFPDENAHHIPSLLAKKIPHSTIYPQLRLLQAKAKKLMQKAKKYIDKEENHILGPSTVTIAKKFKELIQKDELTIADLEGVGEERLKKNHDQEQGRRYSAWSGKLSKNSQTQQTHNVLRRNRPKVTITMNATHKGVIYLNQYNIKSLMKLSEVKMFSDGTLVKIQGNLIDILSKNKLVSGNKRLKGRDLTNYDVNSLKEMVKMINEVLRHREKLTRLEEYVGGRPKTVNPHEDLQLSTEGQFFEYTYVSHCQVDNDIAFEVVELVLSNEKQHVFDVIQM
nr:hypothetical protein [Tanacetum cinerariifolium]